MSSTQKTYSVGFLEEMIAEAKKHLPRWLYLSLVSAARSKSGGKARHQKFKLGVVEKITLDSVNAESLAKLEDGDLQSLWKTFCDWYQSAEKQKESTDTILNKASPLFEELNKRGVKLSNSLLKKAIEGTLSEIEPTGPLLAPVAFVGANIDPLEKARQEYFVGDTGICFKSKYLEPLGLDKSDVYLTTLVPKVEKSKQDHKWYSEQIQKLEKKNPLVTIALGQEAKTVLGKSADFVLPHPVVVKNFDSGEVARKIKKIKKLMKSRLKVHESLAKKANPENEDLSYRTWKKSWYEKLRAAEDKVIYKRCWLDLTEDELDLTDKELFEKGKQSKSTLTFGPWNLELLETKEDDFTGIKGTIEAKPQYHEGSFVYPSGDMPVVLKASDSEPKYIKTSTLAESKYTLGVCKEDKLEFFLDKEPFTGRYLLMFVPVEGGGRWLIEKSKDQKPFIESTMLTDTLSEAKSKNQNYIIWGGPGEEPLLIDVQNKTVNKSKQVKITKSDPVKRIVYGVVLDPYGEKGPTFDAHDDWNPPAHVEETAHNFAKGDMVVKLQHKSDTPAKVVETWIELYPSRKDYLAAMRNEPHKITARPFGDDTLYSGSWVMGVELSPEDWKRYEKGQLNAFSPGGFGVRVPFSEEKMPKVEIIELVERVKSDKDRAKNAS